MITHIKNVRLLALWSLMIGMVLGATSCKHGGEGPQQPSTTTLASSTQIASLTRSQLTDRVAALGINVGGNSTIISLILQRDVKAYRITYKTKNTDGAEIVASGALIVPVAIGTERFPMISLQHGTIFDDSQAPSYFTTSADVNAGTLFASNRYIVACPDYVGFGESKSVPHPYLHRQTEAQASLDMLRAARDFVSQNGVPWDNEVFLAGYSQGGHSTMSMLKLMEEQYPSEFTIKAASCGAGPYNVEGFMQDLVTKGSAGNASYNNLYVWVLQTYNRVYGLNRPMTAYFKEPYASDVQANGNRSSINTSINNAFSDAFKSSIVNGTDADLLKAVRDNNVYDWKPKTPLLLVHGTADQQVFYRNSTDALTAMKARGVTDISLTSAEGKDHGTAIQDFILGTYAFFTQRRSN